MEIRPLTPTEQKYTYAQSMQIEGQTGTIGHLRGDFATTGYGFYTTWFDTRPQWKTDEFKADLDTVINALREDKGLLHNRYDMGAFARKYPESAMQGNYCTEYGFRVDTGKHAFLFRCNPTKGDYNFYCYCYVKEWLNQHMEKAEQGIRFIDTQYKELFRIPDGGKIMVTTAWGEKREYTCRFIDEYHTEVGNNLYHIGEFAEFLHKNGAACDPISKEPQATKAPKAEDEKSSAFVVSQEDIDSVLQMGSSYDKSKYRIYRQLQKNSDSKTNIEFLKKEYGTGGGTHIFPDGTQGGRWADSKGIAIEKQGSYTDPDLRLSWSKVEKRLRELIKNDRYLNPKEKDHYADYLEQVSAPQYEIDTQRKLVRQRFIQSKQALSPADKRDSLALRLSDFIRDLDGYEKELLSQVNRTDLANINDRQMEEQLSDPATVQQLLDFLALVQGKTSDT